VTLNKEDFLNVTCVADSYVYREIVLRRNGIDMQEARPSQVNETRVLSCSKKAGLDDSTNFECIGYLRRGGEKRKELKIQVNGKL